MLTMVSAISIIFKLEEMFSGTDNENLVDFVSWLLNTNEWNLCKKNYVFIWIREGKEYSNLA